MKRFFVLIFALLLVLTMTLVGCGELKSDIVSHSNSNSSQESHDEPNVVSYSDSDSNQESRNHSESHSALYSRAEQYNSFFLGTLRPEIDLIANSMDEAHDSVGITLLCRRNYEKPDLVPIAKLHETDFSYKSTDEIICEIGESEDVWHLISPEYTVQVVGVIAIWTSCDSFGNCSGRSALDFNGDGRWDVVSDSDLNTKISFLPTNRVPLFTYADGSTLTIPESVNLVDVPPEAASFSDMERLV